MAFKNPKNLKQISEDPGKEQIITEVIRICNKLTTEMMEEGMYSFKQFELYLRNDPRFFIFKQHTGNL